MEDLFLDVPLLKQLLKFAPDSGLIPRLIKVAEESPVSEWNKALKELAKEEASYKDAERVCLLMEDAKLKSYAYEIYVCFIMEYGDFLDICRHSSDQRRGKLLI